MLVGPNWIFMCVSCSKFYIKLTVMDVTTILEILYHLKCFNFPFAAVHVLDSGTNIKQQNITQALDWLYLSLVECRTLRCAQHMKSQKPLKGNGKSWLVNIFCCSNTPALSLWDIAVMCICLFQGHLIFWLQPAS